ncbi:bifunctional 5,10-methylenetetrahydrofolate dehydrogenase/5,10-methenyltetrahydrofolate cyclohydrolase [Fervidobacterium thailandense]|uniref:Bifunctional protein FolD n=1 Tax=Fervidobacterium thailandense TaxID=1008305 RepID=A0A1E3G2S2_9BACT|nr:bifunctional 5,10-methylenetetrahydrofolate dehydrogenase/5,10-methenyltetrahydrofolate cyclohydrolase [Fervidobacterium thailandense]ODN30163.1 bifunctional 5,10-methylene-tetrahydrofolate dehydrogenase/5,10-methylene-tetrahydrofolate cyclohydrolase [Fervidobacterium thailandense]
MFVSIEPLYASIVEDVKARVSNLPRPPKLAVVTCQPDPSTQSYLKSQEKMAKRLGIEYAVFEVPKATELKQILPKLSTDVSVDGILLTHPLPSGVSEFEVASLVSPEKDVEGRNPHSLGSILYDAFAFAPCTAEAVVRIIKYFTNPAGKRVVVVGRSVTVGKPVAMLLTQKGVDATVTICHSRTPDIPSITREADIVVVAIGRAKHLTKDYFKPGALVVDVGINVEENEIVGDVDPSVAEVCDLTPVPGGVGKVTTVVLMEHVVRAAERRILGK